MTKERYGILVAGVFVAAMVPALFHWAILMGVAIGGGMALLWRFYP